jgi:PHD/YefM family antitoxin component YafN of YafNO toxin-antitoxin module
MRAVSRSEAETSLASLIQEAQEEPILIEDGNKQKAVIVSFDSYERGRKAAAERFLESSQRLGEEALAIAAKDGLSGEDLMRMLDRKAE